MEWQRDKATITELYEQYKKFGLILKPFFQRNFVWTASAKSKFIETILLQMPISEIYLLEEDGILSVIDGQQRLSTIFYFINEQFLLKDIKNFKDKKFSEIDSSNFLEYEISYIKIYNTTKDEVIDMYSRINQYTVNLNEQELRKASFSESDFLKLAEDLSEELFFENAKFFTPRRRQRMLDVEYISEVLCILFDGIQDKKDTLNEFYELYTMMDDYQSCKNNFIAILEKIKEIFQHPKYYDHFKASKYDGSDGDVNLGQTRFRQFADFYSLFFVIKDLKDINFTDPVKEKILTILIFMHEMIEPESDVEIFREYAIKCVSQGNTKQSRKFRADILKAIFKAIIDDEHNEVTTQIQKQLKKVYNINLNIFDFDLKQVLDEIDSYYAALEE